MSLKNRQLLGYAFVSPWLLGVLLLIAWPFLASLVWSFCRYDLLQAPQFVGTEHYARLTEETIRGEGFGLAMWNTLYYAAVSVPISVVLGIFLAVVLSKKVPGQSLFRTLVFLPSVVPVVVASVLWVWLLDPASGIVNWSLGWTGLSPQWFKSPTEAFWPTTAGQFGSKDALVLMSLWGVGNFMVIYLAALGDVPKSLHEAASLDGAGPLRRFCHVTLPMLTPVIFFNLVMGLIQSFQTFTQAYVVSEGTGEPARSLLLVSLHLFLSAFSDLEMGYASAIAWILFLLLAAATAVLFRSSRRWVHYQGSPR
jgi:multiple sugar transport system permease protein